MAIALLLPIRSNMVEDVMQGEHCRRVACSAAGPLPCSAIPRVSCFGKPSSWKFTVLMEGKHWERSLSRHEWLHVEKEPYAPELISQARMVSGSLTTNGPVRLAPPF